MAKNLRQRLGDYSQKLKAQQADQRLLTSWTQGLKFQWSQERGQAALNKRAAAKKAGRAKARDIYLKDQA